LRRHPAAFGCADLTHPLRKGWAIRNLPYLSQSLLASSQVAHFAPAQVVLLGAHLVRNMSFLRGKILLAV
jgi:hypothetical protein